MPPLHFQDANPVTLHKLSTILWWGLQGLLLGLLVLVAVRAGNSLTWMGLIGFIIVYLGDLFSGVRGRRYWRGVWFALLCACWAAMAAGGLEGAFVVFPLFFIAVYYFSYAQSAAIIAGLSAAVILFISLHLGWNTGAITGPIIGAMVAWALGVGFRMLHQEATAKAQALEELVRARESALASSRRAGEADERMRA